MSTACDLLRDKPPLASLSAIAPLGERFIPMAAGLPLGERFIDGVDAVAADAMLLMERDFRTLEALFAPPGAGALLPPPLSPLVAAWLLLDIDLRTEDALLDDDRPALAGCGC